MSVVPDSKKLPKLPRRKRSSNQGVVSTKGTRSAVLPPNLAGKGLSSCKRKEPVLSNPETSLKPNNPSDRKILVPVIKKLTQLEIKKMCAKRSFKSRYSDESSRVNTSHIETPVQEQNAAKLGTVEVVQHSHACSSVKFVNKCGVSSKNLLQALTKDISGVVQLPGSGTNEYLGQGYTREISGIVKLPSASTGTTMILQAEGNDLSGYRINEREETSTNKTANNQAKHDNNGLTPSGTGFDQDHLKSLHTKLLKLLPDDWGVTLEKSALYVHKMDLDAVYSPYVTLSLHLAKASGKLTVYVGETKLQDDHLLMRIEKPVRNCDKNFMAVLERLLASDMCMGCTHIKEANFKLQAHQLTEKLFVFRHPSCPVLIKANQIRCHFCEKYSLEVSTTTL